jgi:hypothetical protein
VSVLGLCSTVNGVVTSDCALTDLKGEYSVLVFESGSRSGADASAEMVRLWTSRRLWAVEEVPLDVELLEGLSWRFDARRRANGTRTRTTVARKRKPPRQLTMITAMLVLFGECEEVGVVFAWHLGTWCGQMTYHSKKLRKSTHQRPSRRRSRVAHLGFFDYYGSGSRGIVNNRPQGVGRVRVITKFNVTIGRATGRMKRPPI